MRQPLCIEPDAISEIGHLVTHRRRQAGLPSKNRPRESRRCGTELQRRPSMNKLTLAAPCLMNKLADPSAGIVVVYAL